MSRDIRPRPTVRRTGGGTGRRRVLAASLVSTALLLAACGGGDGGLADAVGGGSGIGNAAEVPFDYEERCDEDPEAAGCLLNPAVVGTVFVDDEWTVRHAGGRLERLDAGAPGGYHYEFDGPMVAILFLEITNTGDEPDEITRLAGDTALVSMGTMNDCSPEIIPSGGLIEPGETFTIRICGTDGTDGAVGAHVRFACSRCEAQFVVYPDQSADDDVLDDVTRAVTTLDERTEDSVGASLWDDEVVWLRAARNGELAAGDEDVPASVDDDLGLDDGGEVEPPPPPPPPPPPGSGTMPTSGDDVSVITGFWEAYAGTWQSGSAFEFMAANNYPGMGDDPDDCRAGMAPLVDVQDVVVGSSEPDPGWIITGMTPAKGELPDGDVYATELSATYVYEDGTTAQFENDVHSTRIDDRVYGFFECGG